MSRSWLAATYCHCQPARISVRRVIETVSVCCRRCSSLLRLESLEAIDLDVLHERVELLLALLVLVPLARDSNAHLARHIPDARSPNLSVQQWVNAHLLNSIAYSMHNNVLADKVHLCPKINKSYRPHTPLQRLSSKYK